MNRALSSCPVCASVLYVSEQSCDSCGTKVSGQFAACGFCGLSTDQTQFLHVFLAHRGNLSGVGGELGISYPTVAKRLDAVLGSLGLSGGSPAAVHSDSNRRIDVERQQILEKLDRGEITAEEATKMLKDI